MRNNFTKLFALAAMTICSLTISAADIPLTLGTYLTTSESVTTGTINNNDKGNLGGIYKDATATFKLRNTEAQKMVLSFLTGNYNASDPSVAVKLYYGDTEYFYDSIAIPNTGSWDPFTKHVFEVGSIPADSVYLKFTFHNTSSYVCNLGSIGLYNKAAYLATLDAMPGDITLNKGTYRTAKIETGGNVGFMSDGAITYYPTLYVPYAGIATLNIGLYHYGDGTLNVQITDLASGEVEVNKDLTITSAVCKGLEDTTSFELGEITDGHKSLKMTVSTSASYLANYKALSLGLTPSGWKDFAIDLRDGQLGTSTSEATSKYLVVSDTYSYVDAEPEYYNALLSASSYNGNLHGYINLKAKVPVGAGIYKITLGACEYGNNGAAIKNSDESSTLSVRNALGQTVTSFSQNLGSGNCYHNNTTNNVVSVWYTATEDETITVVCDQYTPYIAIERVNSVPLLRYAVTFVNDTEGASGIVPATIEVTEGDSFTIPTNFTLYKEGYTLTGWNDGTTTHSIGASITPEDNVTLTAVFTENVYSLNESLSAMTIRWKFVRDDGVPEVQWEGVNGKFLVSQATINGVSTDVKLLVNTSPGKFQNKSNSDWAQVNAGTTFKFPSQTGAEVRVRSMNEPKKDDGTKSTLDGTEYSAYASNIATYTAASVNDSSVLTIQGGSWYTYIEIDYPAYTATLPLKTLVVDSIAQGNDILAPINFTANNTATISGQVFTTEPVVEATFSDDAIATFDVSGSGTTRTYTYNHTIGETPYTFTLIVEGIQLYTLGEKDAAVEIKWDGGEITTVDDDKVWTSSTNSAYTMTMSGISGTGADFKFDAATDNPYTITVPSNVVVKQFILKNFHANYSGGNGQLKTVTSEGATVTMPTYRTCVYNGYEQSMNRMHQGPAYDLVVNIENHTAGTPIVFTMLKSAQPMGWIQLTIYDDSTVDIDQITNDQSSITNKVLRNGQVFILRDGRTYNMMGVEVK